MILTTLDSIRLQIKLNPGLEKAIEFLNRKDLDELQDGRYEVDGDNVYALVQTKASRAITDMPEIEGHKKYIDFHYLTHGEEIIGWVDTAGLERPGAYQEDKDAWKTIVPLEKLTLAKLTGGLVMVCFPNDGHAPLLLEGETKMIRKYVMKVRI